MKAKLSLLLFVFLLIACSPATTPPSKSTSAPNSSTQAVTETEQLTLMPAQPAPVSIETTNLALNAVVSASIHLADFPPELAVDGITRFDDANWWGAGDLPRQWFEIDLGGPATISSLRLLTSQFPEGETQHRVFGCTPSGELEQIHEFRGETKGDQWLEFTPESPWLGYSCLRIETLLSPSWVAWREIQVFGYLQAGEAIAQVPTPADNQPTLIFYNAEIISMEEDLPIYEAIAIHNELILQLGSNQEILALAAPSTKIIDLEGQTLMPGIVDAHTHILSDQSDDMAANQQLALENGFTTLGEMSTEPNVLEEFIAFAEAGNFRIRTNAYLSYTNNCGEIIGDWYLEHQPGEAIGKMLRISGVKVFADGGTCGLPAISWEYPTVGGTGALFFNQEEMNAILQSIHDNGYQIVVHAQGDVAIEITQNAFELILQNEPNLLRHRIDHNPFHRPDLVGRYSEIGIYPVIFGAYATCAQNADNTYANFFGPENLGWLENWRAFVDANPDWPIAWHGDDPWLVPLSPFLELFGMVTRAEVAEDGSVCRPADWLAAHAISVEEALPMMTINSAFVLNRDDEVGSLEAGKLADMILISVNPLSVDPYEIKDIYPLMTMVGGVTEFCADGATAFCP